MNQITVGVAGHVDHGKTALVRALTGIETDRLKEEKVRGMSIVLGFAHLSFPEGEIDFIDVPGHERFVHTMITGATGIDRIMLVIAATERVKPQTREHLSLAALLGVQKGLVVVTKGDLIMDPDERGLVEWEVREYLQETFLRDAPLLWTSTLTGEGITTLQEILHHDLVQAVPPPLKQGYYLPIDRVFTKSGYGTVVTGTLRRGPLRVGQRVEIVPSRLQGEVRALEMHGQSIEEALPSQRTAINLRGIKQEEVHRGDALAPAGLISPSRLLDVQIQLVPDAEPLRRGQMVRLHFGTTEILARVHPLLQEKLEPGESSLAQLRLTDEVFVPVHERYVIRSVSPVITLGGGIIVDAAPQRHRVGDLQALARVMALATGASSERVQAKLQEAREAGRDISRLTWDLDLGEQEVQEALEEIGAVTVQGCSLDREIFYEICEQIRAVVHQYHAAYPMRRGMPREDLRRRLPEKLPPAHYAYLLEILSHKNELCAEAGIVREYAHSPEANLTPVERAIAAEMEECYQRGGLKPPNLSEVIGTDRRRKQLYHYLREAGRVVELTERASNRTVTFHPLVIAHAAQTLRQALPQEEGLTVSAINHLLDTTRKYSISLLEYFDAQGVTKRIGDLRVSGDWKSPEGGDRSNGI